jgi:hypothetical protein
MINTDALLSVVMPVYNERTTIDAIVRRRRAGILAGGVPASPRSHRQEKVASSTGNQLFTLATNVYNTMLTDTEACYKVMKVEVLGSI